MKAVTILGHDVGDLALLVEHEQCHVGSGGLSQAQVTGGDLFALVQECPDAIGPPVVGDVGTGGGARPGVDHQPLGLLDGLRQLETLGFQNIKVILPFFFAILLFLPARDILGNLFGNSFVLFEELFIIISPVFDILLEYLFYAVGQGPPLLCLLFLLVDAALPEHLPLVHRLHPRHGRLKMFVGVREMFVFFSPVTSTCCTLAIVNHINN